MLKTSQWAEDPCKREADSEEECEKVFMQTYSFLNKVQDHLAPVSLLLPHRFSYEILNPDIQSFGNRLGLESNQV